MNEEGIKEAWSSAGWGESWLGRIASSVVDTKRAMHGYLRREPLRSLRYCWVGPVRTELSLFRIRLLYMYGDGRGKVTHYHS